MRAEEKQRGEQEQTVGLVCCCVLPCLGFHQPDDCRLIPGDSFLAQEILPSVRMTEEVISLLHKNYSEREKHATES